MSQVRRPPWLVMVGAAVAAATALIVFGLTGCGVRLPFGDHRNDQDFGPVAAACPRPDAGMGQQPQFNGQERQVRYLRQQAFAGDFFAQLELGRRYEARSGVDKNLEDPVEAAVWYALALTNPTGYAPVVDRGRVFDRGSGSGGGQGFPGASLFEQCRGFERGQAAVELNALWNRMSSGEQDSVRKRVIYVLSSQGAPGFRILSRISSSSAGAYGEPSGYDRPPSKDGRDDHFTNRDVLPVELFPRNDVDSYLYDYLAAQAGDIGGYVLMKDMEGDAVDPRAFGDLVIAKANRWVPPFEFYPPEAPGSGVPHSDESVRQGEASEMALLRMSELPFIHVGDALRYLQVIPHTVYSRDQLEPGQAQALQAMLGREQTGVLSPLEKVRAIQLAATSGSAKAQLVLAVMYAEGIGVRADYARAFDWFQRADREGSPEAKFAVANYFSLGVAGVADQDKAEAVVHRLDSALAGFRPQSEHIQAVLAQICRTTRFTDRRD